MRVLLLSCNTGGGHTACAKAIQEKIEYEGHEAELLDIMQLSGDTTAKVVGGTYVNLVMKSPTMFQLVYRAGMAISSAKRKSPVYYANALLAKRLAQYVKKHGFDLVVTTHLFPAETLTYMKQKGMSSIPTIAVMTDYTCIPFWEETDCDYYIVPHEELVEELVERGMKRERLFAYGIPVGMEFSKDIRKQDARKALHLPFNVPIYLLVSGSMGFGHIKEYVAAWLKVERKKEHLVIICGNNLKMKKELKSMVANHKNIHIIGYTRQMAYYMAACDVCFTKPGGLTSTEAAVRGIPIVHMEPIPGCETENRKFFIKNGMSVSSNQIKKQVMLGVKLMQDTKKREQMIRRQRECMGGDATQEVFELLCQIEGSVSV